MPTEHDADRSVHDEIVAILAKETGISAADLHPDSTIHDLGIQSIDLVQAIFAIETRFDIELPPDPEGEGAGATVRRFVDHVTKRIDARSEQPAEPAGRATPI